MCSRAILALILAVLLWAARCGAGESQAGLSTSNANAVAARFDGTLAVKGSISLTNTGSAHATLGNIVVSLQKRASHEGKNTWVSAAANVADATLGDAASVARIVASASAEDADANAGVGAGNFAVAGSEGIFNETSGSGALDLTDAGSGNGFPLVPQPLVAPGATLNLSFLARFDNDELNLAEGTEIRIEILISYGNAGSNGKTAASNLDVNGSGSVDPDEAHVKTVPARVTVGIETNTLPDVISEPWAMPNPICLK